MVIFPEHPQREKIASENDFRSLLLGQNYRCGRSTPIEMSRTMNIITMADPECTCLELLPLGYLTDTRASMGVGLAALAGDVKC
jgi:hypothetical protein